MKQSLTQLLILVLATSTSLSCKKSSSSPEPPPPPPPVVYGSSIGLLSGLPGEIILDGEINPADPNMQMALSQQNQLPEERLNQAITNIFQSSQSQNNMTGNANQTSNYSFEVMLNGYTGVSFSVTRKVNSLQMSSTMGNQNLASSAPMQSYFKRNELAKVYDFSNAGRSFALNQNFNPAGPGMTMSPGGPSGFNGSIQSQFCFSNPMLSQNQPGGVPSVQTRFYAGRYHSPLGGPEVPVYSQRITNTIKMTCQNQSLQYGYNGPINPTTGVTEVTVVSEEVIVYAPRALIIGNYSQSGVNRKYSGYASHENYRNGIYGNSTSNIAIPLFRNSSTMIVGGPMLRSVSQMIQCPTF